MEEDNVRQTQVNGSSCLNFDLPDWIVDDEDENETDQAADDIDRETSLRSLSSSSPPPNDGPSSDGSRRCPSSPLESLAPDLTAWIFQHLTVQEIASIALVSKALREAARNHDLWKLKFESRWNLRFSHPARSSSGMMDWYQAYRQAYLNTHDLWITHWNCVYPHDGLAPGRCCIQPHHQDPPAPPSLQPESETHLCPSCRYLRYPNSKPSAKPIATVAQAISAATRLRLLQSPVISPYSSQHAKRAFANASTLHRTIVVDQYESSRLYFLSDLLFFTVHDGSKDEIEDMKRWSIPIGQSPSTTTAANNNNLRTDVCETAMHSWHLVQFTNPDFNRPLVWRISIQRMDCFTVFPSEGYLRPGESKVVVFGVRPFGSLLAHATHQLNVHREGVDEFWANVYTEEAHLPAAPFLIHYHFATVIPCRRAGDDHSHYHPHLHLHNQHHHMANPVVVVPPPGQLQQQNNARNPHGLTTRTPSASTASMSSSPWQHLAQPQQPVRTMYLSAHVHANYSLAEFQRKTLVPFSIELQDLSQSWSSSSSSSSLSSHNLTMMAYCAPQLMEHHPYYWSRLENLHLEYDTESRQSQAYKTESTCEMCRSSWGSRMEELGQAYVVAKIECEILKQQRDELLQNMIRLLRQLQKHYQTTWWTKRHNQLLFMLHNTLTDFKGSVWLTRRQHRILLQWEVVIDELCRSHLTDQTVHDDYTIPWRHAGIYRQYVCTDYVFGNADNAKRLLDTTNTDNDTNRTAIWWKEEPNYLEAFAHLAHSPGRFCLGPQEDPNHLQLTLPTNMRFRRRQQGFVTDIFMDDPICGLQSALCVLSDPRSLLVHGIYDRVTYPGTLVRRPKTPILPPMKKLSILDRSKYEMMLQSFLRVPGRLAYYQLQNALDMESLLIVDSWCLLPMPRKDSIVTYPLSLHNYLHNIPSPGMGRYPLSTETTVSPEESEEGSVALPTRISPLLFDSGVQRYEERNDGISNPNDDLGRFINAHQNDGNVNHHQNHLPPPIHGGRGPRALNLLWVVSANLGWTVDDNQGASSVYVDRRILIGAQWLSISLMVAPLFWTLFARYAKWIPTTPVDYPLQGLPFDVETEMRYGEMFAIFIVLEPKINRLLDGHLTRYMPAFSKDF